MFLFYIFYLVIASFTLCDYPANIHLFKEILEKGVTYV